MWHGKIFYGKCYLVVVWHSSTYEIGKIKKLFKNCLKGFWEILYDNHNLLLYSLILAWNFCVNCHGNVLYVSVYVMNEDVRVFKDALEDLHARKITTRRILPCILSKHSENFQCVRVKFLIDNQFDKHAKNLRLRGLFVIHDINR